MGFFDASLAIIAALRRFTPNRSLITSLFAALGSLILINFVAVSRAEQPDCQGLLNPLQAESLWIEQIVEDHLDEVQSLFSEIVRKYPMATTEFILVGRSPSLLYAYLKAQSVMYPQLRSWMLPISLTADRQVSLGLSAPRFMQLFEAYRKPQWLRDRKLVFIDFVMEGRTFLRLERLLLENGIEGELVGFAYEAPSLEQKMQQQLLALPVHIVQTPLEFELSIGRQKRIAPYPSHKIQTEDYVAPSMSPAVEHPTFERAVQTIEHMLF